MDSLNGSYIIVIWAVLYPIVIVSSTIAAGVYLAKYYSDSAWKEQLGTFLTMLIPILMVLLPLGFSVFWIIRSLRTTGKVDPAKILVIWMFFIFDPTLSNMLFLVIYSQLFAWIHNTFILEYSIPIAVAALGIFACIIIKDYLLYYEEKHLEEFYYFAQKIVLGIFFMLHLILSFWYLSVILENDKGRPVKICEFVFIYILTVTTLPVFWKQKDLLDTGKQPLDLRLIVLISGSVFLFGWFVIHMSAYWLDEKEIIKEAMGLVRRHQGTKLDQRSCDNQEMNDSSPSDPDRPNAEQRSHDNQGMEASSPADHNEVNTQEVPWSVE